MSDMQDETPRAFEVRATDGAVISSHAAIDRASRRAARPGRRRPPPLRPDRMAGPERRGESRAGGGAMTARFDRPSGAIQFLGVSDTGSDVWRSGLGVICCGCLGSSGTEWTRGELEHAQSHHSWMPSVLALLNANRDARTIGYRIRRYVNGAVPKHGPYIARDPDCKGWDWEFAEHAPEPTTRVVALVLLHMFRAWAEEYDDERQTVRLVRVVRRGR